MFTYCSLLYRVLFQCNVFLMYAAVTLPRFSLSCSLELVFRSVSDAADAPSTKQQHTSVQHLQKSVNKTSTLHLTSSGDKHGRLVLNS